MYRVIITPEAASDLERLAYSEPKAFAKASLFIGELREHPKTGTGIKGSTPFQLVSGTNQLCITWGCPLWHILPSSDFNFNW